MTSYIGLKSDKSGDGKTKLGSRSSKESGPNNFKPEELIRELEDIR